ncbi:MAG: hypothetical protein KFF77_01255, partial [Bacteroidetes bacterium]|nr:hypothetical protein [Bacteroidota bacterium]
MSWFSNLRTKYKLLIGFGVVIAFLIALIAVENLQSGRALTEYERLQNVHLPINQAGQELINDIFRERLLFAQLVSRVGAQSSAGYVEYRDQLLQQQTKVRGTEVRV